VTDLKRRVTMNV